MSQATLMQFDPSTGAHRPYPSHAEQYRSYHGIVAWLFNPWSGERRYAADVGSDPYGMLIHPTGENLISAGGRAGPRAGPNVSNANNMAFPALNTELTPNSTVQLGLTKRELFAAMAMQGFAACPGIDGKPKYFATKDDANAEADRLMHQHASRAVEWADALLAALAK